MTQSVPLHHYLDVELITVRSDIASRKRLLQEMAILLSQPLVDTREKDVYHLLLEREKLGNTGIGNGVALPHSRCAQADKAIVAIITLQQGIDYDSTDRQAVDVAFGLLVPQSANEEHLKLLATIASMMSDEGKKMKMANAGSSEAIISLVQQWSNELAQAEQA